MRSAYTEVLFRALLVFGAAAAAAFAQAGEPRTLWRLGRTDGDTSEFALGPKDWEAFASMVKQDPVFAVGLSDPGRDWPYAHPGPADNWAGNRAHTFTIVFGLQKPPARGGGKLVVDLVDIHRTIPPVLQIKVNGRAFAVSLPRGASDDSIAGAVQESKRHRFDVSFPADLLRPGNNVIAITNVAGSWMLYDSISLETPADAQPAEVAGKLLILEVKPTPLFPRVTQGKPLKQNVQVRICNLGPAAAVRLKASLEGHEAWTEDLGPIEPGCATKTIQVPDIARPSPLTLELHSQDGPQPASRLQTLWQPQKKWKVYCVSYSHHDLGYGNYPHRLRTDIRHANIERPLQFCRETDAWDDDSKFRYVIETSEPITSYLGAHSAAEAAELARRIREGRIQIGGIHNTANTEQLSVEGLARLFYLSGRHTPDLLEVPAGKTAQIDDVVGLTWGLATCCQEAGRPYFFHGHNPTAFCLQPAHLEPVFYWQGPDGKSKVLMRSFAYGGYGGDALGDASEAHVQAQIEQAAAANCPYDAIMCQDGSDFQLITMDNALKIREWNRKYSYPRLICATMDMFFDDMAGQVDRASVKTFAKDANNLWADQDANDAPALGAARRQGEAVPTAEKFSTIASTLTGGGYPWLNIYQAYHRLLAWHEHTNAALCHPEPARAGTAGYAQHYETELVENREMLLEAESFCNAALGNALSRLTDVISTDADRTLIVFNSLSWPRTDSVRVPGEDLKAPFRLVDVATGREISHQRWPDGTVLFVAPDVPATGYKTFRVLPGGGGVSPASGDEQDARHPAEPSPASTPSGENLLENRYYRIRFDSASGAIVSILDKELDVELVDASAPHKFNEYLYEYYAVAYDKVEWRRQTGARLAASSGPVAGVMTVTARARGVERLEQQVVLYNDLKRIDFALSFAKSPSGRSLDDYLKARPNGKEAVYAALPLSVPDFQLRHETPGAVVEPTKQQFAGSCTAFYAVRHFADVFNSRYGVTLATVEAPLVEYGRARSCTYAGGIQNYESVLKYPTSSHLYLYLMNNMFETNARIDQRGPMRFNWSIRSHAGDWRQGRAAQFGWEVNNPLLARLATGRKNGPLPAGDYSFMSVDRHNVVCTTLKPAEANGSGLILRFNESDGVQTTATVSLPFFGQIAAATETSLVEDDRPAALEVADGSRVTFTIPPFGIKTIRVTSKAQGLPARVTDLQAEPVSDMEVALSWQVEAKTADRIDHYNVYRGTSPDFRPTLLNLVARPSGASWTDRPQLNYGGWINNRLEPDTTYYYRVSAVDRWNNEGPISAAVQAKTLKTAEKNAVPLQVEGLRVILVSRVAPYNFLNLLWRTNCESDVKQYNIHRGTQPGFVPDDSNRIGVVDADTIEKGSPDYGHTPIDRKLREFDHQMYRDEKVQPGTTYYYRVCAVDAAGQAGPYSLEAKGRTKPAGP